MASSEIDVIEGNGRKKWGNLKAVGFLLYFGLISLYFGIGGTLKTEIRNQIKESYDFEDNAPVIDSETNLEFANYAELKLFKENQKAEKFFPFLSIIPEFVASILSACFFGMLGGIISLVRDVALRGRKPEDTPYVSLPLLSFFTGLAVLGLNYTIPTILVSGETQIRPITLLFLSLFAGLFSSQFFKFLSNIAHSKIFRDEK